MPPPLCAITSSLYSSLLWEFRLSQKLSPNPLSPRMESSFPNPHNQELRFTLSFGRGVMMRQDAKRSVI